MPETSNAPAPSTPTTDLDFARIVGPAKGLLLFVLAFLIYLPAIHGQFVWDDPLVVQKNPLVTGEFNPGSIWFHTDFPLSNVVLWIGWLLWKDDTTGYHVVNTLLHALNAVLVWRVLGQLKIRGAWLAAALFAVHPVCVASVAWISELKNTLSLPFFLAGIWCYLRFDDDSAAAKKACSWYWLTLGAFVLALLSKTSTVMLPVVLLACIWWRHGRLTRPDCLRTLPFFALALVFGVMSIWFQKHQAFTTGPVQAENFFGRLAGAGMALWFYLGKALLPFHLNLIYPRWEINAASPVAYLPLLGWCFLFYLGWWARYSWGRALLFALGCFTATLFPALGFFDMYFLAISRVSDHFQYLPLICIVALVTATLNSLLRGKVLQVVGIALVLVMAGLATQRAGIFATEEKLWEDTLAKNPDSWSAHNNLGSIRAEQGKMDEAMAQFEASVQLNPHNAAAHINLGRGFAMQKKFVQAETHFEAALQLKPNDPDAHFFYAQALADEGKKPEAIIQFREALRLRPDTETQQLLDALLKAP